MPFLVAMRHPTANARSLNPSRWKEYLLPHVDPHVQCKYTLYMHNTYKVYSALFDPLTALDVASKGQYAADLLHYLMERRAGVTIVKLMPSDNTDNVVAGLNILTEILKKLKNGKNNNHCALF